MKNNNFAGVKISIDKEKSLSIFYDALCNVYGNGYWNGYGLAFDYSDSEYNKSKIGLKSPCFEDVIIKMLKDGYKFSVIDEENGKDSEYNVNISLNDIYEKVQLTPFINLSNILNETDDITDSDIVLQMVFFGNVIFG